MTSYIVMKQQAKKRIMGSLHAAGELDLNKLLAQESLETGFTKKTIKVIIDDLELLNYLIVENGIVKKVPPVKTEVSPQ